MSSVKLWQSRSFTLILEELGMIPIIIFFCIYLLVMPKYWGKFSHAGDSLKWVKTKSKRRRKEKRKTEL